MRGLFRKSVMKAYFEASRVKNFLSSFFKDAQKFDTESVSIDIQRSTGKVAVDIVMGTGGNLNMAGKFTEKEFTPPFFDEYTAVDAFSGWKRLPGESEYSTGSGRSNMARAIARVVQAQIENEKSIKRAIELQASQALFDGKITLKYPLKGSAIVDFKRKAELHPTVSTEWRDPNANALNDVERLCQSISQHGKTTPKILVFGEDAYRDFDKNNEFNKKLDQLYRKEGNLQMPVLKNTGAIYHGTFTFGNYVLEMWTYPEKYEHPETKVMTPYVPANKVLLIDPGARYSILYGGVPIMQSLEKKEQKIWGLTDIPMTTSADFMPYVNVDKKKLVVEAGVRSRPLVVPTAIDCFGTLTVGV